MYLIIDQSKNYLRFRGKVNTWEDHNFAALPPQDKSQFPNSESLLPCQCILCKIFKNNGNSLPIRDVG